MQSEWFRLVTWLATSNQSALFQSTVNTLLWNFYMILTPSLRDVVISHKQKYTLKNSIISVVSCRILFKNPSKYNIDIFYSFRWVEKWVFRLATVWVHSLHWISWAKLLLYLPTFNLVDLIKYSRLILHTLLPATQIGSFTQSLDDFWRIRALGFTVNHVLL